MSDYFLPSAFCLYSLSSAWESPVGRSVGRPGFFLALWDFPGRSARIAKSEPYFAGQSTRGHKIRGFGNPLRAKPR